MLDHWRKIGYTLGVSGHRFHRAGWVKVWMSIQNKYIQSKEKVKNQIKEEKTKIKNLILKYRKYKKEKLKRIQKTRSNR